MRAVVTELAPARASKESHIEAVSANQAIEATIVKDQSVRKVWPKGYASWKMARNTEIGCSGELSVTKTGQP
ncbi:MAG: hypothetical protein ACXU8R_03990 [Xanthobacteraceae bacterium]